MKKIQKSFFKIAIVFLMIFSTSCNFLVVDEYFDDTLNLDSVFHSKVNLEKYIWGAAAYLPDESSMFGAGYYPGIMGSDECITLWDYEGQRSTLNEISPDNISGMDIWHNMYIVVRKANTILARIDECTDLSSQDKRELVGYTRFMRAYAYYHLLMSYGPFIIVGDKIYDTSLTPEAYENVRSTYDECADYICAEMETAAQYIPEEVPINYFGRPTKGAVYGLIARVRVFQASPLYNGGAAARRFFSQFVRSTDKVHYVSQTYEDEKWARAAAACKRVIDMGKYDLYTVKTLPETPALPLNVPRDAFPNGAGDIDPFHSYNDLFTGEALAAKNPEYVFGRNSDVVTYMTQYSFPPSYWGGYNGLAVPQKIIDAFYMRDGKDIKSSSVVYPYSESGFTVNNQTFSGYELKAGTYNMYNNREMRFYANIGFHGCFWPMSSTTEDHRKNITVTYSLDGNSGLSSSGTDKIHYPLTGYVSKKYIHKDDAWQGSGAQVLPKAFGIIRYADILLMYAESLNNIQGSYVMKNLYGDDETYYRNTDEISRCFNMVRYRSGLPGLEPADLSTPGNFQSVLVRERMLEFFHEGRRYFDVRRWGIIEEEEAKPIMGMNTDMRIDNGYFSRVLGNHKNVRNRVFLPKMILLPISRAELKRVPNLDQNPFWD